MAYVFLHIPKTAGLTLREVLKRLAPDELINDTAPDSFENMERRYEALMRYLEGRDPEGLKRYYGGATTDDPNQMFVDAYAHVPRERFEKLELFMDHYFYGIHEILQGPVTYLTMLRDPVERVLSAHRHFTTRHGLRSSLREFVMADHPLMTNNTQTRHLVGRLDDGRDIRAVEIDQDLIEIAKANLQTFGWVGVTERFDESLLVLQRRLDLSNAYYRRENVSEGRIRRKDLDGQIIETIERANRYDHQLWRFANQLLDEARTGLPPFAVTRLRATNTLREIKQKAKR